LRNSGNTPSAWNAAAEGRGLRNAFGLPPN